MDINTFIDNLYFIGMSDGLKMNNLITLLILLGIKFREIRKDKHNILIFGDFRYDFKTIQLKKYVSYTTKIADIDRRIFHCIKII